jgi:hypothetical protein
MRPYVIFWQWLPLALAIAEDRTKANKFLGAIQRLKAIEGESTGTGTGQTGYLNNNDPYQAIKDYVAHVYDGGPAPFWLTSAERG